MLWKIIGLTIGISLGTSTAVAEIRENLPNSERKPLFELGIGAGSGYFPHYPASDQGKWLSIALPTFRYRGSFLKADEEDGVRATILSSANYGIELSGSYVLPARSRENSARSGMPDLDVLGEIGPLLHLHLFRDPTHSIRFVLPVRGAGSSSLNFSRIKHRGFTASLGFDLRMRLPDELGVVRLRLGVVFASQEYHAYFYDVSDRYVNESRRRYTSSKGYLGANSDLDYSVEWDSFATFIQFGFSSYQKAANEASPLFRSDQALSGLIGLRWLLYKSDALEAPKF